MQVIAEREHYLLVSDGTRCTVVERRAGKFYPLCNGIRHGVDLDDEGVAELMRWSGAHSADDTLSRANRSAAARRRDGHPPPPNTGSMMGTSSVLSSGEP